MHFVESSDDRISSTFEVIAPESPLHRSQFFAKLLRAYDFRYPYMAEQVPEARRVQWEQTSPIVTELESRIGNPIEIILGYAPRFSS